MNTKKDPSFSVIVHCTIAALILIAVNVFCWYLNERPLKTLTNVAIIALLGVNIYNSYIRRKNA